MNNPLTDAATGTTVFNNFVKITDWIIKGKGSEHPMPAGLASLFDAADDARNAVDVATAVQRSNSELIGHIDQIKAAFNQMAQTITEMQQVIAAQQGVIEAMSGATQQPAQQPVQPPAQQPVQPPAQQPVQPPVQQPVQPPAQQPVQPPAQQPVQPPAQQPVQPPAQQPVQPPAQQPVQPPAQQPYMQIVDLGEAVTAAQQAQPTPTAAGSAGTQTIEVLAADIDAGELNPDALAALDAEIAQLMNAGQ